nr:hypothetical protein CFP56_78602 [Quercus suber]
MLSSPCAASKTNDRKLLANFSISHVHVEGRCLSPAFVVENIQPSGTFVLKKDMRYMRNYLRNPNVIENEGYESGEEEDVVDIEEYESGEEEYESGEEEDEA